MTAKTVPDKSVKRTIILLAAEGLEDNEIAKLIKLRTYKQISCSYLILSHFSISLNIYFAFFYNET